VPAFAQAIAARRSEEPATAGLGDAWRQWLNVRDACPLGRAYRYGDDQIAYHYRSDRRVLERP